MYNIEMKHIQKGINSSFLNAVDLKGTIEEPSEYPLSINKTLFSLKIQLTILGIASE